MISVTSHNTLNTELYQSTDTKLCVGKNVI